MEKMISGVFADILKAGRERFNVAFQAARLANPALDAGEFSAHLSGPVVRLVEAVAGIRAERCEAVATALYDSSLDLFRHDLLGSRARSCIIQKAWSTLLPLTVRFLLDAPTKTAAGLFNALHNLSQESDDIANTWLDGMSALVPHCHYASELAPCGMVLAWRGGLPHYRESALSAWTCLPDNLKLLTLGLNPETFKGSLSEMEQKLKTDRWYRPESKSTQKELCVAAVCGGFRGLGGPFLTPPVVDLVSGGIVALDDEGCWCLYADTYGSSFKRLAFPESCATGKNNPANGIYPHGNIRFGERQATLEALSDFSCYASTDDMLVVALKESHYVYVVAPVARE